MDTSNEYTDQAPQAPESRAERIAAISALVQGQDDDVQPATQQSDTDGEDVQVEAVRADDSGPGEVDLPDADPDTGVSDDPETAQADGTEADPEQVTLANLAEHLGVEASDIYELDVPLGGELGTVTLGQLKDEYKEYGPAKEYQAKLTGERQDFEKSVLQTRAELNAIVNAIPPELRESVINAGREHQSQWAKDQETAVLEAIPDWQDADRRAKDRAYLIEDGAEYGFSEAEITYTQDARTLRMLRDFSTMKRELQDMRAAAKREPGRANAPAKSAQSITGKAKLRQALQKAKADPTMQGKASVVSQLIRNQ